jgi:hypothetical protein
MVVVTAMIAIVMPPVAVVIIKVRHTARQQYGGSHGQ